MEAGISHLLSNERQQRALARAVRHVNVSTRTAISESSLLDAVWDGEFPQSLAHHIHAFIDETDTATLSDFVTSGLATYGQLARLADGLLPRGHDTRSWLDGCRDF